MALPTHELLGDKLVEIVRTPCKFCGKVSRICRPGWGYCSPKCHMDDLRFRTFQKAASRKVRVRVRR